MVLASNMLLYCFDAYENDGTLLVTFNPRNYVDSWLATKYHLAINMNNKVHRKLHIKDDDLEVLWNLMFFYLKHSIS
jgi:transcriptional regulatory protein LevR